MKGLNVQKRDGKEEDWSDDKLVTSIAKAGLEIKESEKLGADIKAYFASKKERSSVSSLEIRDKVLEELEKIDPVSSDTYKVFKK